MLSTAALDIFKKKYKKCKVKMNAFNTWLDTITTKEATQEIIHLSNKEWDKVLLGLSDPEIPYTEIWEAIELDVLYEDIHQLYTNLKLKAHMAL